MRTAAYLVAFILGCTSVNARAQPTPPVPAPYPQPAQPRQATPEQPATTPAPQAATQQPAAYPQPAQPVPSAQPQQLPPPQQVPYPPSPSAPSGPAVYPQSGPTPQAWGNREFALELGGPPPQSWSDDDESWYQRNRRFSLAGKILTLTGIALAIVYGSVSDSDYAVAPGVAVQLVGQLTWSAADLRGALELQRRGFDVSPAAGIVSVIGALLFSPLTWIAGPIQSARIRHAHEGYGYAARSRAPRFTMHGTGFRATF